MKRKIKGIYKRVYLAILGLFLIGLMLVCIVSLTFEQLLLDPKIINGITLLMVVLSLPNLSDQLLSEFSERKKKITCKCPNCKHLIKMEFTEE
ncbi:hypothetical protein [Bacillus suaedae]|uniref:Uncharacterized protein n=1 Tax=Halalkalibacter suaedae TaxID=2822140 RepID=A0A940WXT7_9BACI|nr:hypothetical protein [Bacillus suaedae]MBP3950325.1 hypothetical protein [Bacillus suaedae]